MGFIFPIFSDFLLHSNKHFVRHEFHNLKHVVDTQKVIETLYPKRLIALQPNIQLKLTRLQSNHKFSLEKQIGLQKLVRMLSHDFLPHTFGRETCVLKAEKIFNFRNCKNRQLVLN